MIKGSEIRKRRKEMGLSTQALADLLKVKVDNLYKWEKGTKPTDPEDYIKLENWLSGKLENVPWETSKGQSPPAQVSIEEIDLKKSIKELSEATNRHSKIDEMNAKNIDRLLNFLEKAYGIKYNEEDKNPAGPPQESEYTSNIEEKSKANSSK